MVREMDDRPLRLRNDNFMSLGVSNIGGIDHYRALLVRDGDGPSLGDEHAYKTNELDTRTFSIPRGCNLFLNHLIVTPIIKGCTISKPII